MQLHIGVTTAPRETRNNSKHTGDGLRASGAPAPCACEWVMSPALPRRQGAVLCVSRRDGMSLAIWFTCKSTRSRRRASCCTMGGVLMALNFPCPLSQSRQKSKLLCPAQIQNVPLPRPFFCRPPSLPAAPGTGTHPPVKGTRPFPYPLWVQATSAHQWEKHL